MQPDLVSPRLVDVKPSLLQSIWKYLKRLRKFNLGPIAFAFKFERAVHVTPISRRRMRQALPHESRARSLQAGTLQTLHPEPSPSPAAREIALIVGVGPGLGYALAHRLANEGMAVVMASRNAARLTPLARDIGAKGGTAFAYGCDATNEQSIARLFEHVMANHGIPNLVIYSLQCFGPGEAMDVELPAFEDGWRHNCLGAFLVARQAARAMVPAQRGTIILTGSTSSLLGRAGHLNLAVGKFGQRAIAQVMARELWPKGIHVAHLVIDADIREGADHPDKERQSDPVHVADLMIGLHRQARTAWTSEIDARPWNENFWEHC
ncbi:SDR family NAD(P)-dependent oxidoreductase [Roseateles oligotrophus]|uniref:SDR family NAD(P)-dependent oxidoreductase n=1 Tax=Roseateles oligotrophus TaxID=1769250 RepID=A0ABT2YKK0_9BURK|nr:SDR family NAD(P)-dependent oxidoreductase [Roseateles oligotrophus]MCV2370577.1 SDR family NAD(P)-dependent oxidoreductase [Roseateles oligotrophus]